MNMRKKSMNNNYGHKKRYGGGGGNNRPRKNYNAMREKYLSQARDALASGDRVLAENFLQHADHCWRMMMEENQNRPRHNNNQNQNQNQNQQAQADGEGDSDDFENNSQLPAFLTGGYDTPQGETAAPAVQNWEERDN